MRSHCSMRPVLTDVANELRDRGALSEEECFIDATFVMAKGGGLEIGVTKRGKGMKTMAIVHAANHHEVSLVQRFRGKEKKEDVRFRFLHDRSQAGKLDRRSLLDSDPLDA